MIGIKGHKRDRHQGQHLDKDVDRSHVGRESQSQGDPVGHDIETEKAVCLLFMFHIVKGVQHDQRPHNRDQQRKHHGQRIEAEPDRETFRKAVDLYALRAYGRTDGKEGCPDQDTGKAYNRHGIAVSHFAARRIPGNQEKTAQYRQQDGKKQKQRTQNINPPTIPAPNRPITSATTQRAIMAPFMRIPGSANSVSPS